MDSCDAVMMCYDFFFLELYLAACLRSLCLFESPELIENVKLIHKPVSLQPRGLINKGNWCYINAVSFHSCCTSASSCWFLKAALWRLHMYIFDFW